MWYVHIEHAKKQCLQRGQLYGQATQDGCSLALCTCQAMLSQCLLHLHAAHRTDLPIYLPKAPTSDCYQRGSEAHAPLPVSLVTDEPTWHQFPHNYQTLLTPHGNCHHILPAICHTWWGIAPGTCFRHVRFPLSNKPLTSLLVTPGSFFGLETGQV